MAVLLIALSTLYLDVFRNRLSKERTRETRTEAKITGKAASMEYYRVSGGMKT